MRASDIDRRRAVDELRRHCAAGRIGLDEYASRIEQALSADTLEELDTLRADLPMLRIADPSNRARGRVSSRHHRTTGAVALLSVPVVFSAIVLSLAAEWRWAAVLIVGWLVGLVQGRFSRLARRP